MLFVVMVTVLTKQTVNSNGMLSVSVEEGHLGKTNLRELRVGWWINQGRAISWLSYSNWLSQHKVPYNSSSLPLTMLSATVFRCLLLLFILLLLLLLLLLVLIRLLLLPLACSTWL